MHSYSSLLPSSRPYSERGSFRSGQHAQETKASEGWAKGREKTLELESVLSRPSNMQPPRPRLIRFLDGLFHRRLEGYSPGDVSVALSSSGASKPSSGQDPGSWLFWESEARASLAGGERELSVHLAASVWKLPTGVVPPDDSPPRDFSSSLWASSMSLSLLSLWVSCSMVRKILPTSLRARLGGERLERLWSPLLPCSWG